MGRANTTLGLAPGLEMHVTSLSPAVDEQAAAITSIRSILQASRVAQMMYAMAELGLPELLTDGPRTADSLADAAGAQRPTLYRLLRALAAAGFVTEEPGRRFSLTAHGAALRHDAPGELASQVRIQLSEPRWRPWGDLLASVRAGRSTFRDIFGVDDWEYQAQHPDSAAHFNAFMSRLSARQQDAIVSAYDFSRFGTIVDVGGGQGRLLAAILQAYPTIRGILFDQPDVVKNDEGLFQQPGLRERCTFVGGNFFESVPEGGDAYVLKSIIHDWNDEAARTILRTLHRGMSPGSTLLLMDWVLPDNRPLDLPEAIADLNMLVVLDGKERTAAEFAALFEACGFRGQRVIPTGANVSIVEAIRV